MIKEELKKFLIDTMNWQRNLTSEQYNKMTFNEAFSNKLNELMESQFIKHILDKIGDSDIVPTRKVTTIAGDSKIKRMITHNNKIVGCLYEDDNINWFDMPEAEEAKKLLEDDSN